ncbi:hypothetical protein N7508_007378 [Penicillium antarcticum]|uniref:uncharacterized protein n=1 Tax=Penicillium antarcticum TaxID=416450 RepID=UPI0023907E67|nr:uncharacterized protein N7508_007378 [Penicillium antarcticum]KAJ5300135.1 hypothetical protein N7508_007378 [Penicillium antarcticum]
MDGAREKGKWDFSQVTFSPTAQRAARRETRNQTQRNARFCTKRYFCAMGNKTHGHGLKHVDMNDTLLFASGNLEKD